MSCVLTPPLDNTGPPARVAALTPGGALRAARGPTGTGYPGMSVATATYAPENRASSVAKLTLG